MPQHTRCPQSCNTLQHSTVTRTAQRRNLCRKQRDFVALAAEECNTMQHTATQLHTATHWIMTQHTRCSKRCNLCREQRDFVAPAGKKCSAALLCQLRCVCVVREWCQHMSITDGVGVVFCVGVCVRESCMCVCVCCAAPPCSVNCDAHVLCGV